MRVKGGVSVDDGARGGVAVVFVNVCEGCDYAADCCVGWDVFSPVEGVGKGHLGV